MLNQPPPMVTHPMPNQQKTDDDHLRILGILHFVTAGLAVLGVLFIIMHYMIMNTVFGNPEVWNNKPHGGGPSPDAFFDVFKWFYLFMGSMFVLGAIGNLLSGIYLRKKKNRLFSMIVAGVNCLQVPLGTLLGVFTFIVLMRDSVRETYAD